MIRLAFPYGLCFVCMLLSACGARVVSDEKGGGDDSSTHWLSRCTSDEDCGELQCLCGVCSKDCQREDACDSLSQRAVCSDAVGCDQAPRVCTQECEGDGECASGNCSAELCQAGGSLDDGPVFELGPGANTGAGGTTSTSDGGLPRDRDFEANTGAGGTTSTSDGGASGETQTEPESPVTTMAELCGSLDELLSSAFDVELDGMVEARQVSTAAACVGDAGAPVCCNWTWTAYVVPCPDGDVVLKTEGEPFGVATAVSAEFDDGIGPVDVTMGCQGMDCDPICVPASPSDIGLVRATLEPSDGGFVLPGDGFEEFDGIAALVILEDLGEHSEGDGFEREECISNHPADAETDTRLAQLLEEDTELCEEVGAASVSSIISEQAALCIVQAEGLDRELSPWETQLGCDGAYQTIVWVVEAPGNALYVDARDGTLLEWAAVADGPS